MADDVAEGVIDRLIEALAAQVDMSHQPTLAPGAVQALTDLSREEANRIFGQAGHLVHYGIDTQPLENLMRLISNGQRSEAAADAAIVPGDQVRLVGELPASLAAYDQATLRETVFVVRYVCTEATVDVQPELTVDYVIVTVPIANVARVPTLR